MISLKYSYENTSAISETEFFFWVAASVAEVSFVNPKCTKTILTNGVNTFFINGKEVSLIV